jgi:acyl carrier protein phosphodiesterase
MNKLRAVNYLAHAYLSFGIPEILVGNLISDFVKGKKKLEYPAGIQAGISLHRAIDTFTDTHPVTRQAKSFFRSPYGLYSGPLTDVAYDHFLANDPMTFSDGPALAAFARQTYEKMAAWSAVFPERFGRLFPYMRDQNWLYHYRFKEGIFNSFAGLSRRATYMQGPEQACVLFEDHYQELGSCYREFFPALKEFAAGMLEHPETGQGSGKFG